ncbi:MAG: glycosyltransferase family 2 protein [Deferribacteraceae bacterium]|jgi:glycosyltransferase involved in cell wall biosynthesis|nr:glycosyltransferase family 2 protein [Deferribacteraceae bacterium]
MKLIIQIPCFNEEASLPITFADLPRHIDGIDAIEYLVIDDGSTDRTVETAKELGVNHIVSFKRNKGLAAAFTAGVETCLRLGADIIVNTDADNQYQGGDIAKLVKPILDGKADITIGARPIADIEHFSWRKKKLQRFGSFIVRLASQTDIPDAPSGFRAYSKDAALRLNVINQYTYTLETIIQAGRNKMCIVSVPVSTNPEIRKSRLFKNIGVYISRSAIVILRTFLMYKPLKFFFFIAAASFLGGAFLAGRFIYYFITDSGSGHVQSLIAAAILLLLSAQTFIAGLQADIIAANRKILEDVQYILRKAEYEKKDNL